MNISDKIKHIRRNLLKQTQKEFAIKIGVSRNTIKNWENALSKPTTSHLLMIGMTSGVSLDFLIFDDVELQLCTNELDEEQYQIINNLINYIRKHSTNSYD